MMQAARPPAKTIRDYVLDWSCHRLHGSYNLFSCQFVGDKVSMSTHHTTCKYEMVKDFLQATEDRITDLSLAMRRRDEENSFLR